MQPALRHPPAFVLEWPASRFWRGLQAMLAALCLWGLAAWAHDHQTGSVPWSLMFTVWVALSLTFAVFVTWRLSAREPWRLRWDGSQWWLHDARGLDRPVDLRVTMDLGDVLLLRWRAAWPDGAVNRPWARWALVEPWHHEALDATHAGAQWHLLRVALYCRPS